jgi:hypothetical protein
MEQLVMAVPPVLLELCENIMDLQIFQKMWRTAEMDSDVERCVSVLVLPESDALQAAKIFLEVIKERPVKMSTRPGPWAPSFGSHLVETHHFETVPYIETAFSKGKQKRDDSHSCIQSTRSEDSDCVTLASVAS